MKLAIALSAICGLLVVSSPQAVIARWTPAKADATIHGKCVGIGKPVSARYAAFRCVAGGRVVWVKVRPDGKKLCFSVRSLAAVPAACMHLGQ